MWKKFKKKFKKLFFRGKLQELNHISWPSKKTLWITVYKTFKFSILSLIAIWILDIFFTSVVSIITGFVS